MGSFAVHLSLLAPLVREICGGHAPRAEAMLASLEKRLFLDAERAFERHVRSRLGDLETRNRELTDRNLALAQRCAGLERPVEEERGRRPVAAPAVSDGAEPSSPARSERVPGAATPHRVLVIDDDEGWVELLETMLAGPRYIVCPATDPDWAMALARLYDFDLAIMDWKLGRSLTGLDLGRRLQSIDPTLKCILISGDPEESVRQEALEAGFSRFLGKPFDVESLREAVGETLRGAH